MARRAHGAADFGPDAPLGVSERPEYREGLGTVDRGLVGSSEGDDIVVATVAEDGAFLHSHRAGVVRAVGLDNVVFDQGFASPTIDGDVAVSAGQVTSRIAYVASRVQASNSGL